MPDQHDSAQRPRPFVPPVRPFRGPATATRPASTPLTPLTPPNGGRSGAPFVARRPAKTELEGPMPSQSAAPAVEAAVVPDPTVIVPQSPAVLETEPVTRTATGGADAHLYGHDPFSAGPATRVAAAVDPTESAPQNSTAREDAATALAGLPFFDDNGGEHEAGAETARVHTSGKLHRVEFDPAVVLETIAGRIRSGALRLPDLDPRDSEEATLAAILAALLRDSRR